MRAPHSQTEQLPTTYPLPNGVREEIEQEDQRRAEAAQFWADSSTLDPPPLPALSASPASTRACPSRRDKHEDRQPARPALFPSPLPTCPHQTPTPQFTLLLLLISLRLVHRLCHPPRARTAPPLEGWITTLTPRSNATSPHQAPSWTRDTNDELLRVTPPATLYMPVCTELKPYRPTTPLTTISWRCSHVPSPQGNYAPETVRRRRPTNITSSPILFLRDAATYPSRKATMHPRTVPAGREMQVG